MITKYCTYCEIEHPVEQFPQKHGKPHGSKCTKYRSDLAAEKAKQRKIEQEESDKLNLSAEELEIKTEAEKIKAEVKDPNERKRLLVNLRQKHQRVKQKEKHKNGTAPIITEKVCTGKLCKGKTLPVEKFSKQQYGDGYQPFCKDCRKYDTEQKLASHENVDLENTFKTCKNKNCACENPQPLTAFDKHANYEHGRNDICKACRQIERSTLNYPRKEFGTKQCFGEYCKGKFLDVSHFHTDKYNSDGLHSCCKKCHNLQQRESCSNYPCALTKIFNDAKNNAKRRGIKFSITKEDIDNLYKSQDGKCAITGIQMTHDYITERQEGDSHIIHKTNMSIDRIHNSKGYVKNNIQLVCAVVNRIKHDMNPFELMFFVTMVGNNTCRIIQTNQIKLTPEMEKRIEQKYKYTVSNAKTRNLEVNITHEYLNELYIKQNGKCALTGQPLTCNKTLCDISVDRIDSNKNYTKENVQLVLDSANQRKADLSNKELSEWSNNIKSSKLFLSQLMLA